MTRLTLAVVNVAVTETGTDHAEETAMADAVEATETATVLEAVTATVVVATMVVTPVVAESETMAETVRLLHVTKLLVRMLTVRAKTRHASDNAFGAPLPGYPHLPKEKFFFESPYQA